MEVIETFVIAALALNGILCTAALIWLLRRAGRRRDRSGGIARLRQVGEVLGQPSRSVDPLLEDPDLATERLWVAVFLAVPAEAGTGQDQHRQHRQQRTKELRRGSSSHRSIPRSSARREHGGMGRVKAIRWRSSLRRRRVPVP